jgi:hypothetical protein
MLKRVFDLIFVLQVSAEETVGENEASKRYTISFIPIDVGDHSIEVRKNVLTIILINVITCM